jgi:hypothetical protein
MFGPNKSGNPGLGQDECNMARSFFQSTNKPPTPKLEQRGQFLSQLFATCVCKQEIVEILSTFSS